MNKRIFITLQIGLISFFMFADQNLMGPNLTLIADDFGMTDVKVACPPKVVPSVKLVVVQTARKREYDT